MRVGLSYRKRATLSLTCAKSDRLFGRWGIHQWRSYVWWRSLKFLKVLGCLRMKARCMKLKEMPVPSCNFLNDLKVRLLICNTWDGNTLTSKINNFTFFCDRILSLDFLLCSHIVCLTINSKPILNWCLLLAPTSLP